MPPTAVETTRQATGKVVHLGDGSTIPLRVSLGLPPSGGGGGGNYHQHKKIGLSHVHLTRDDSLLLLLVLLCLGDNHKFGAPVHQTPRLLAYLPSDGEQKPSGVLLLPGQRKGHINLLPCPIGAVT